MISKVVKELLSKGAIASVEPEEDQVLSTLFLISAKDENQRPLTNAKYLNQCVPYRHFKMEGLYGLKELLTEEDYMCKLDLRKPTFVFR